MTRYQDSLEFDSEEDEYLEKVPARFRELVKEPKTDQMIRPWINGWD